MLTNAIGAMLPHFVRHIKSLYFWTKTALKLSSSGWGELTFFPREIVSWTSRWSYVSIWLISKLRKTIHTWSPIMLFINLKWNELRSILIRCSLAILTLWNQWSYHYVKTQIYAIFHLGNFGFSILRFWYATHGQIWIPHLSQRINFYTTITNIPTRR